MKLPNLPKKALNMAEFNQDIHATPDPGGLKVVK